ncbi:MAG TPA: prepilin-type N-terminal cleavage/methylation domain-containing protein [Blastocatellia bacterium]|nr:prepilin-type N-terminal cleavage/methylation domain-containing protein [Blastocatellia bacterium]
MKQRGFSLVELMVATTLTVGLTGAVFFMFNKNLDSSQVERANTDLQQNFRAAMDLISRDIQAAGAGMPQFLGPLAGQDGGTDGNGNPLPDEILILYGNPNFPSLTVNGPVSSSTASFVAQTPAGGSAPTFTNGKNYVLYTVSQAGAIVSDSTDAAEFSVFTLNSQSAVSGGTQLTPKATPNVTTPAWSNISNFPSSPTLRVVELDELIHYRLNTATSTLQRSRNGGAWVDVARGITDLQFQYRMEPVDTSVSPPTFTQTLVSQPGTAANNNRALIRSVLITLTGQTQLSRTGDNLGQRRISQTVEVTPRNLVLPGFVPNR